MVGREWLIKRIMSNVRHKQNTMLIGPGGIGKTDVLKHICDQLGDDRAYYIEALIPAKSAIKDAHQAIGGFSEEELKAMKVSRWTLTQLVKAIIKLLKGHHFVLILDSLDRITVASSEWLKELAESDIILLGACRQMKQATLLDRFTWTFDPITLKPMNDSDIKEIVRQHIYPESDGQPAIQFRDRQAQIFFVEQVIKISKGIPLTAAEYCRRAKAVHPVTMSFVREHMMKAHQASVKKIDATPLLLAAICFIIVMRYVARGMGDVDAYVLFGGLSAIMLIMRFFIMRGPKKK